jgi:hypothetical protein
MRNGGELSNLEYIPTKTENAEYLWNTRTRTSRLSWPFILRNNRFKQALDHEKRWRIERPRPSTYQTRKCGISLERGNARLWSLLPL